MTAEKGVAIASINMGDDYTKHVDTGTSSNAKSYVFNDPSTGFLGKLKNTLIPPEKDKVFIIAPMEYDIYLERRFGIMARVKDMIKPYMKEYEEFIFDK